MTFSIPLQLLSKICKGDVNGNEQQLSDFVGWMDDVM